MRQLVFVHGRSQQNKDAAALKAEWIKAFRAGLAKEHLELPIAENEIRFPYFGDALADLVEGKRANNAAEVILKGRGSSLEREFTGSIVSELAATLEARDPQAVKAETAAVVQKGPLNWEWVLSILRVVDQHVPFGSGASIALFTHDVYQYLRNPGIRDRIEGGVFKAFTPGAETVVVGHSLGTLVSYQLLRREGDEQQWRVPLLMTVGAPLAITAIKNAIRPIGHPTCVTKWFNAMDERDVVALYPLTKRHFNIDPTVENKTDVDNQTENRHGISGYLSNGVVAKRIYDVLTA